MNAADTVLVAWGVLAAWGLGVLGLLAVVFRYAFRTQRRSEQLARELTADVSRLEQSLQQLRERLDQREQREEEWEARLAQLGEQQDQLLLRDAETGPYLQAIRAARAGSDVDELVRVYGMSEGEADLVVRLHGK